MILTIDIGNTTVSLGGVNKTPQGSYLVHFMTRLETDRRWGVSEYTAGIRTALEKQGLRPENFQGSVISSVVPGVAEALRESARQLMEREPVQITVKSDTGLTIDLPEPERVGCDRLVDAAWVAACFPLPAVTADLGTATTFNVIRKGGVFCGGVIAAGIDTGLQALADRAAQLPRIDLCVPDHIIGRNTEESMISGAVAGTAAMLDGIVQAIEQELGEPVTFVITGGTAKYVEPLVRHPHIYDPELLLKGLAFLYERNRGQ